jgi:hypothetical protein
LSFSRFGAHQVCVQKEIKITPKKGKKLVNAGIEPATVISTTLYLFCEFSFFSNQNDRRRVVLGLEEMEIPEKYVSTFVGCKKS